MNSIIIFLSILGIAAIAFSFLVLIKRWYDTRWFDMAQVLLLLAMVLFFLSDLLEWMGISALLDPYESLLLPLMWIFFFFAILSKIKINDLKRAQDALRISESKARILLENLPQKVFFKDKHSIYVSCNENFARDLNIAPDEIAGKTDYDFFTRELAKKYREDDNRLIVNRKTEEIEEQYITNGQKVWVHTVKTPVIKENGEVRGILGIFWDITENKRAEIALRESEERLRIFIEHAPTALAMFDKEMRYLAMSHRWMTDYGLSYHNVIGRSQYELFPDIPDQWKKVYNRGLNGEVIRAEEDQFLLMDGTVQWLRWEVRPWYADIGNVGGIVIFTENITVRKYSENALRKSEEWFRKIFENATIGIAITDWDGNFQQCNPFYCKMLGYTMDELRRVLFYSHIWPEDREAYQVEVCRLKAGEIKSFEIENRYIRKNGQQIWGRKFVSILTDNDGKPAHLLGLVSDITEHRHTEIALRQSEERFRKLYENAAIGIAITDWEGRFLQCNPAFCNLLGYTEEEFRTMKIPSTVHPDDWENYLAKILSLQAGEIPFFEIENRCVHKDGHFLWDHKYISVLTDETGKPAYLLGLTTNVTERKQAEDALNEIKERLRLATKVANLGTFDWDLQTNDAIF